MKKACVTINQMRKKDEIISFGSLLKDTLQGIEIFYPYNMDLAQQKEYAKYIAYILAEYPYTERVLHLPFGANCHIVDPSLYPNVEELQLAAIGFASRYACDRLTLHLGTIPASMTREEAKDFVLPHLITLAQEAKKHGMWLDIENMPSKSELGYYPEEIVELIKRSGMDNIGVCFDTGHAHVADTEDTKALRILGPYLKHIHLNDNHGERDEHKTFGMGNIDFKAINQVCEEIGYDGLYCLEIIYHTKEDIAHNAELFRSLFTN